MRLPAASPRWRRVRVAIAHDAAAECLWAEIANACQRSLPGPARVEAAIASVLAFFEEEPDSARVLVLTVPLGAELQLAEKHRLLRDHLAELLCASLPEGWPEDAEEGTPVEAIERAFALIASQLGKAGATGIGRLARPLARLLAPTRSRGRAALPPRPAQAVTFVAGRPR